ncbi:MAG: tyrosine--tRNA ligase [Candidatus Paceibacterota bacterium]|jgi:tyrosyl-tRNA synthetase
MAINTDPKKIDEILSRSIDKVYPTKEALRELLSSGRQLKIYMGIDPTADYVHIGHSTNYLILERLHQLGHKIIVLVGDFTAMIGDPSDKTSARVQLSREDVNRNLESFKDQIGKILNFEDKDNPIEFRFNSEWLGKLDFAKLIDLASNFTVQQMLERDMFAKRLKENKPLYVQEFFYPLMQGYDSVALDVDLEIGGTDQTFNMLAGRILEKRYLDKEKLVMTTTLLTNPVTGEKLMSKSLGTGVSLKDSPDNMFGKVMAIADEGMIQVFIDCTRLTMGEIEAKKKRLEQGENPRDLKLELAKAIVAMYYDDQIAETAQANWQKTFSQKETPEEITEFKPSAYDLITVLVESGLAESKSEAKRAIEQNGVKVNEETVTDPKLELKPGDVVQKGKRFFVKLS